MLDIREKALPGSYRYFSTFGNNQRFLGYVRSGGGKMQDTLRWVDLQTVLVFSVFKMMRGSLRK